MNEATFIRMGVEQDAEAISYLVLQSRHAFFARADGSGTEQFVRDAAPNAIRQYLLGERHAYLLAERSGCVLGALGVRDRRHVFHLFVAEEVRQQGIARALWEAGRTRLLGAGAVTVNASPAAVGMYERFGFVVTGEQLERNGIVFVPMQLSGA